MISKNELKSIRSLHLKKQRDEQQRFLIEGHKILKEAFLANSNCIECIYTTEDWIKEIPAALLNITSLVTKVQLQQISSLKNPQGIVGVCRYLEYDNKGYTLGLVLDGVQDPGNMGTILRTAAWFGIQEIICSLDTVDIYNPKVVQASMGAIFQVQVSYRDLKSFLDQSNRPIYGALLEGENIFQTKLEQNAYIVLGNEGNGIRDEVSQLITHPISIPKLGSGESLNVAIAGAIIMAEFSN